MEKSSILKKIVRENSRYSYSLYLIYLIQHLTFVPNIDEFIKINSYNLFKILDKKA